MQILDFFNIIVSNLTNLIVGIFQFISSIFNLPFFLASLFLNLPSIFYLGFLIFFTLIISTLVIHIYHMLKG